MIVHRWAPSYNLSMRCTRLVLILALVIDPHSGNRSSLWESAPSVNRHTARQLRVLHVLQAVRVGIGLLRVGAGLLEQVVLKPVAKVGHADEGVDDGQDDEQDGDDGKGRQAPGHGGVREGVARLVDAHELEEEVREAAEVEQDDARRADVVLVPGEEGRGQEDDDGDGDGRDGQAELDVGDVPDDDEKLYRETEEEEEVKLQEGDVNLVVQEALLHSVIGTDLL